MGHGFFLVSNETVSGPPACVDQFFGEVVG
jgi:hypothetical protein